MSYCAKCRDHIVETWLCVHCALDVVGPHVSNDERAPTASQISRGQQRLVDWGAEQLTFTDLQALPERSAVVGQQRSRSRRFRSDSSRFDAIRSALASGPGRLTDAKGPAQLYSFNQRRRTA